MEIPVLTTERLRLRGPDPKDFEAYAAFRMGPRSASVGGPFDRASAFSSFCALWGHWEMRGFGRFIVADRATDVALGVAGPFFPPDWPEPELAWTVFDGAEGRGIAFEATLAARSYAYETLGWPHAVSLIAEDNPRSQALARRLGCTAADLFEHPSFGPLRIWRHPGASAV